jgi:hypothetical protein
MTSMYSLRASPVAPVERLRHQRAREVGERLAVGGRDELQRLEARAQVAMRVVEGALEGELDDRRLAVVAAQVPLRMQRRQEALLADRVAEAGLPGRVGLRYAVRCRRAVDRVEDQQGLPLAIVELRRREGRQLVDLLGQDGDVLVIGHGSP